jgi:outer membrane protein assembly factor BamB
VNRILACCVLSVLPFAARAENWPQWRGPDNDGISHEKGIPSKWSEDTNIVWKLPIPPGNAGSTPLVWGDKIVLTCVDKSDLAVLCVTTKGDVVWKKKVGVSTKAPALYMRDEGNDAGASPSTDGKFIYTYFGSGDLVCLDFKGAEIWRKDIQKNYGRFSIQHGMHVSPLLHEDRVYLVLLTNGGHWVIAFDKASGKEIWKHNRKSDARGESREAYASPIVWTTGKATSLIVHGCDYTTAHRLTDGSEIWRLTGLNPKSVTNHRLIGTPVASPEGLIVPTARGFDIMAIKAGANGEIKPGSPFDLWRLGKGAPDVSSPLVYEGNLYLSRENGLFHCWDAATGKEFYTERRHNDRYRSSPIAVDGKIITNSRDGTFWVIKAGTKYEQLAENKLQDNFTASPVVSGGQLYLRGFNSLYAIGAKQ